MGRKRTVLIVVGTIITLIVAAFILIPYVDDFMDRTNGWNLRVYAKDENGDKIYLSPIPLQWLVQRQESAIVGAEYQWSISEPVDKLEIILKICRNKAGDLVPDTQVIIPIENPALNGTGTYEWAIDSRFDSYKVAGREWVPIVFGDAVIYQDGEAIDTKHDEGQFYLQWNPATLEFNVGAGPG